MLEDTKAGIKTKLKNNNEDKSVILIVGKSKEKGEKTQASSTGDVTVRGDELLELVR